MVNKHHFSIHAFVHDTLFLCLSMYIIMDALQLYRVPLGFQAQAYKIQVSAPQHACMEKLVMAQGYPLHWSITRKQQKDEWVLHKIRQYPRYWEITAWSLNVKLRIVQTMLLECMQFYLPLIN